jgi:hypothetical protein
MGEQSVMSLPARTARSRAPWESLAGVPVTCGPALRVVVSPRSRLCPPGWAGLVVIGDASCHSGGRGRTRRAASPAFWASANLAAR